MQDLGVIPSFFAAHPDVAECAVLGIKDAINFLLVCPSVGKPRADGCRKAGYAIVDLEEKCVNLYRVPYDYEKAAQNILAFDDRLGIRADMMQVGDFKGTAEPYTRDEMSPQFRKQYRGLLDDIFPPVAG